MSDKPLLRQRPAWFQRALNDRGEAGRVGRRRCFDRVSRVGTPRQARNRTGARQQRASGMVAIRRAVSRRPISRRRARSLRQRRQRLARPLHRPRTSPMKCGRRVEAAELGARPFVVGHSFGGFVVLETGHFYGAQLGGIILADFTVSPPEDYTEWGRRAEREGKTRRATRVYPDIDAALATLPADSGTAVPASVCRRLHRTSIACGPSKAAGPGSSIRRCSITSKWARTNATNS